MARLSEFIAPLVSVAYGPRRTVSLAPALRDAQEAILERRKEDIAVEKAVNEILAWAQTHRPKNTSRNYEPKQREWRVSSLLLFLFFYYSFT